MNDEKNAFSEFNVKFHTLNRSYLTVLGVNSYIF